MRALLRFFLLLIIPVAVALKSTPALPKEPKPRVWTLVKGEAYLLDGEPPPGYIDVNEYE